MYRFELTEGGRRGAIRVSAVLSAIALSVGVVALPALADDDPQPVDFTHNVTGAAAPVAGAVYGSGPATKSGTAICTTPTQTTPDVDTDCEGGAHNETSIAVNPTNPLNMIGGANDYRLGVDPGGHVTESILSRAHVTFDGGRTWSEFPLYSNAAYQGTGDTAVAFDASGHAYYGTLGFRFVGPGNSTNPDVLVADSGDSGRSWRVSRVAAGSGNATSVGDLLDKEYVAAWGDGNAIVTFGDFRLGDKGAVLSARIYASVTHDAGATWSTPVSISGSLDEAFVSVPTVAADGRVYVAFMDTTDATTYRDTYEVVEVSPATGARVAGPFAVGTVIDGATDYPISPEVRQTYQDSIFRSWAAGNITADPSDPRHLAVVWSDMRNSPTPAPSDPYAAVTNSDVGISQSSDRGRTWSAPVAITLPNDQFMPWGAYDTGGRLRIGTFDRSIDAANHRYGYTVASESAPGSSTFATRVVSTVASDPTRDDRWFAATVNPSFPGATLFLGDYSNIAATPSGGVVAYWTDMRNQACFAGSWSRGGRLLRHRALSRVGGTRAGGYPRAAGCGPAPDAPARDLDRLDGYGDAAGAGDPYLPPPDGPGTAWGSTTRTADHDDAPGRIRDTC